MAITAGALEGPNSISVVEEFPDGNKTYSVSYCVAPCEHEGHSRNKTIQLKDVVWARHNGIVGRRAFRKLSKVESGTVLNFHTPKDQPELRNVLTAIMRFDSKARNAGCPPAIGEESVERLTRRSEAID